MTALFGYVRPFTPYLRVYENELYKAVYCGLCRELKNSYGHIPTLLLSYDLAFLAALEIGVKHETVSADSVRCPVHPIRKTRCLKCSGDSLHYSASAEIILVYHKLKDDLADRCIKRKIKAAALIPLFYGKYKKAASEYPALADSVELAMKRQRITERKKVRSLDRAAEPTAAIMNAVFRELGGCDPDKRELFGRFGYMLGRYVYISDALDDINEDYALKGYNPLIPYDAYKDKSPKLSREYRLKAVAKAQNSLMLTLGALAEVYVNIDAGDMRPLIDNIVYLGLKDTFSKVRSFALDGKRKRMKNER